MLNHYLSQKLKFVEDNKFNNLINILTLCVRVKDDQINMRVIFVKDFRLKENLISRGGSSKEKVARK
jgi:hypothetical protein